MSNAKRERRRKLVLETFAELGSIRATVRKLGISIHVVRRVLRGQDQVRQAPASAPARPSKLDPFKPVIQRLVLEDRLSAVLVLEEIRALGYQGGYSILKEYVRQIRPAPKRRATTVLEHPPGAEGQVDWSPYNVAFGADWRVVHCFSFVLAFSRFMVVRFSFDETLETLLAMHEEAFSVIGGIPALMTYDNMTTVGRHVSQDEIDINSRFESYRQQCDFEIQLIDPGRPNQHAPVERPFHYIENNCLRRRRFHFDDLADLNRHATWWCEHIANVRTHGSTHERPVDRLQRERALLRPLPSQRPESYRTVARKVGSDFCVSLDTNRYSVPPKHVGQPATLHVYAERLEVFVAGKLAAAHARAQGRYLRQVLPEHDEAFKRCTPSRRLLEQAFLRLGPSANDYYEGLRVQRGRGAGYHLQRILKLADRYGSERVVGAMAHAARYGNYSAEAVARVITGRQMQRNARAADSPASPPPEQVRRWLEGLHVEDSDLADYDRLIDQRNLHGDDGGDDADSQGDGGDGGDGGDDGDDGDDDGDGDDDPDGGGGGEA